MGFLVFGNCLSKLIVSFMYNGVSFFNVECEVGFMRGIEGKIF